VPLLLADDPDPGASVCCRTCTPPTPTSTSVCSQVDLMRWGHAMAMPRPGVQRHPALVALRAARGRVRFAHADLAGCSVFEEAFAAGCEVALPWRGVA
jgi:hypothetical protein